MIEQHPGECIRMCECFATLSKRDPRYELWKQVDPQARIPLKHPLMKPHPYFEGVMCYEGDPSRLSEKQKDLLVELLSAKFSEPKSHVREGLDLGVLPVKADNLTVAICNLHFRCML